MSPPSEYSVGSDSPIKDDQNDQNNQNAHPAKTPFYKRKKFWILCVIIGVIINAILIPIVLVVALPKIVQSIVNGSAMSLDSVNITFPNIAKRDANIQTSFQMAMAGHLLNAGPIGATINFPSPIDVIWEGVFLGYLSLPSVSASGGQAVLDTSTTFYINDPEAFGNFSKSLLAKDSFTWIMQGKVDVTVDMFHRTISSLDLYKPITLNGMGGFTQTKILDFNLPSDDADGGIDMTITTSLFNPSPLGVQLGTIKLNINYGSTFVGPVNATNVFLNSGNNIIVLNGKMVKQNTPGDLTAISELMSNYVSNHASNTTAVGVSAAPDGLNSVGWLSEGFQSVTLNVVLQAPTLQLISGINLGNLDFSFNAQAPYAPTIASSGVSANFKMPFGFAINITQVEQNMTIATDADGSIAALQSTWGSATSNSSLGILTFNIGNSPLSVFPDKHQAFDLFDSDLTLTAGMNFSVIGTATVEASTSIGNVVLTGIPFNTSTFLQGLQGLNSTPTAIQSLDVIDGTTDYMSLAISVGMTNPTTLEINTGDVYFDMIFEGSVLGTVLLPNLTLHRGSNSVNATAKFSPNNSPQGQLLLTSFVGGVDESVQISGFNGTSQVSSLLLGLSQINLTSVLPGLKSKLIQSASLSVLADTTTTKVAHASVILANPFLAPLAITGVDSFVTYKGIPLGSIKQDISSNPIVVPGKTSATSPPLSLAMNLEPLSIAVLLYQNALTSPDVTKDQITAMVALFHLGHLNIGDPSIKPISSLFTHFNLPQFVQTALANLRIDLSLNTTVKIGQYVTQLGYSQAGVPCITDSSVDYLIPMVGQPIVQSLVDAAALTFDSAVISDATTNSFKTQLSGAITGTGPMDAFIAFPTPVTVSWNNRVLGTLAMPSISAEADKGAKIDLSATFTVTDAGAMADFSTVLLKDDSFDWQISASGVTVTALNFTFGGISMTKTVTLKGMKGISAVVQGFQLPTNDPAGGITMKIQTVLNNPSNVGISLNVLSFNSFFADDAGNHLLGPLAASMVTISPSGATLLQLTGRLLPQTDPSDIAAIETIFSNYLAGINTTVSVVGTGAQGPSGDVSWLSTAFKSLTLQTSIPGGKNVEIIQGISVNNMAFDFTCDSCAYAPLVSSNNGIVANFSLPSGFGFPIDITDLEETINISIPTTGKPTALALLALPWNKATTSGSEITTSFSNETFAVYPAVHGIFDFFVTGLTLGQPSQIPPLAFQGAANSKATTAIGPLALNNIKFDLQVDIGKTLGTLQDFGGSVGISEVTVMGSNGTDYIIIDLNTHMNNPSQVTVSVGDVSFEVYCNNASMGMVYLKNLVVKPGQNIVPSEFHLTPGPNPSPGNLLIAVALLSSYMGGGTTNLTIKNGVSTIPSLKGALAGVTLGSELVGIQNAKLVQSVTTVVTVAVPITAMVNFVIANPLKSPFTIVAMNASVTVKDFPIKGHAVVLSQFQVLLDEPLVVAGGSTNTLKKPFEIPIVATLAELLAIVAAFNGSLIKPFNLPVTITIVPEGTGLLVDQFPASLYYSQDNVQNEVSVANPFASSSGSPTSVISETSKPSPVFRH